MPEITLQDIMQKLEQMDNTLDQIKDKVEDIPSIKGNVQSIAAAKLYKVCEECKGTGTVEKSVFSGNPPVTSITTQTCSKCNGLGKYLFGEEE